MNVIRATGLVLLFALGCTQDLLGPDIEQVKKDLVGQAFRNPQAVGDAFPRFQVAAVTDLKVEERLTEKAAMTEEIHVSVSMTNENSYGRDEFRGVLVVRYKQFEQGWRLQSVEAKK